MESVNVPYQRLPRLEQVIWGLPECVAMTWPLQAEKISFLST